MQFTIRIEVLREIYEFYVQLRTWKPYNYREKRNQA
jgi:hypothetical protein